MYPISPKYASKTRRKQARQQVRNILGSSNDEATGPMPALRAAMYLNDLMVLATNGRFSIRVYDAKTREHLQTTEALVQARLIGTSNN